MESAPHFQRKLGLFDATMLVAGSMIGSGIFIVSAEVSRDVGSSGWLLAVWLLSGVMTVIGALSYAELAGMFPHAGGQYVFLREAYGPLPAFLYGWTAFLVIQTGFIAAVGVAFAKFLGVLVPEWGTGHVLWEWPVGIHRVLPVPWMEEPLTFFKRDKFQITSGQFVAVGVILFLTALNLFGVGLGRWVQNIFTVSKIFAIVLLVAVGLTLAANPDAISQNTADPWSGVIATKQFDEVFKFAPIEGLAIALVLCGAMVGPLFSSDAWNNVTFVAAEVKDPRRTLAWGLFLGTAMVVVLYLLANVAYLAALPLHGREDAPTAVERGIEHAKDERVGTAVLEQASPDLGVPLMAVAIMISTFGCINGLTLMGPRLYYAMAQDGLFFRSVGRLNHWGVPAVGLVIQMVWSIVLVFSGSYNELLDYIIFGAMLFYMLTVLAVFVLRVRQPDIERPYRALGYPVVPALYIVLAGSIALGLLVAKPVFSWPSFAIILTGVPVFLMWRLVFPSHAAG